ncbi:MAG TPA: DUF433 domain-containing protein [Pirellulales bacterium]|nr:DUF433 domain-containing protein [Pirellulales bacterium]
MILPDFLIDHPDGEVRLNGHRIGLHEVADRYWGGYSPEMLREEFPTLPLALIHKLIAFCLENQDEVAAYLSAYGAESARQESRTKPSAAAERIRRRLMSRASAIRSTCL